MLVASRAFGVLPYRSVYSLLKQSRAVALPDSHGFASSRYAVEICALPSVVRLFLTLRAAQSAGLLSGLWLQRRKRHNKLLLQGVFQYLALSGLP